MARFALLHELAVAGFVVMISALDMNRRNARVDPMKPYWQPARIAFGVALSILIFVLAACGSKATKSSTAGGGGGGAGPPAGSKVEQEFTALMDKVQTKIVEGKNKEADYAPELKEFDALLARHKEEKTDEVAKILATKTMIYFQIFEDFPKSRELALQIKKEFPATFQGKSVDEFITQIDLQASVAVGASLQDFQVQDLTGKPLSLSAYKGKVVLVDFWATWCVPCLAELPNVKQAYEEYHAKGLEIIGISLDEDRDTLTGFLKTNNVPWPQYFDGKKWTNELATKYAVNAIPATFLLDREGKIVAKNDTLREKGLGQELAKLLK